MLFHSIILVIFLWTCSVYTNDYSKWEGNVVKGNRNALFLVQNGKKRIFPDFNTFVKMGFNMSSIMKINHQQLESIPLGDILPSIAVFRPDDYMYHTLCDDPKAMV